MKHNVWTRLLAIALTVLMLFAFAACDPVPGGEEQSSEQAPSAEQTTQTPETESDTEPVGTIHESSAETET